MNQVFRLLVLAIVLFTSISAFAQERTVTGTVISDGNKTPLEGVTVTNTKTGKSTTTNVNGVFSISAANGHILSLSYVGFAPAKYSVGTTTIVITLKQDHIELEEVTVAMDLKRKPRELGYSVQTVSGAEIAETQRENFINSLQGRIAGGTITPTNGIAGASSQIILRGFNSLSLSNQPIFVVDGVILDNNTIDENSGGGTGIGLASDRPNRNNDYTNRIADINPNDIESVTVLKGPEATALYGSQASSGAIVITTKKSKGTGKLGVNYDNSFRFQKVTRFAETIDTYNSGRNGVFQGILNSSSATYFGPEYPAGTVKFNNIDNFFETGFAQTHNLALDFGKKNASFRASGSFFDQSGVVPNNNYQRINLRISNSTKIGKYIDINPSFSYINTDNNKPLRGAGGYLLALYAWPVNVDVRDFQDNLGNKKSIYAADPGSELDNPLFNTNKNRSRDENNRYIGTLGININPFPWLSVAGRFGYDHYKSEGYTFYHPKSIQQNASSVKGILDNYYRQYYGYNHTITATAKKSVDKWSGRFMAGTMWQDYETRMFSVTGNNLKDSTIFNPDSNNTSPNSRVRLLRNYFGEFNKNIVRQIAWFGEVAISYNNLVFLNYTHRFETASTLPSKNRNYNYPGVSISTIVSDIFPQLKKGNTLSYWKLRASTASTARLNSAYSNQSVFVNNFASGQGFSYGFTNNNPDLMPERQNTYEIGTELKFLRNRLNFDITYYNTLIKDQIAESYRASYGTGFVLNTQNAASTRNQGVEIVLDANPVKTNDWNWGIRFNFNKMWNKVLQIPASLTEYYLADTWVYANARGGLSRGGSTTTITSYGYARNNAGNILISPTTGLPVIDQSFKVRGDRNPEFTLGTINTLRYKNWNLSFLWDLKVGGDIYNGTEYYLTLQGKSKRTADRMTPRVIEGVLNDGLQNSATPTRNTIVVTPFYQDAYYLNMPEEEFIQKDVNWLRLRDVTLSFNLPQNTMKKIRGIKSLGFFVTGNDLILITNYLGADPAVNGNTAGSKGVGGLGFDFSNLPTPISVNFGLKASF